MIINIISKRQIEKIISREIKQKVENLEDQIKGLHIKQDKLREELITLKYSKRGIRLHGN